VKRAGIALLAVMAIAVGLLYWDSPGDSTVRQRPAASTGAPTTTTRPGPRFGAVAVVGDSLGHQATAPLVAQLRRAGWGPVTVNVLGGRRIWPDPDTEAEFSGLAAVAEIKARGVDPPTWIVELGTNDSLYAGDDAAELRRRIDAMLFAIGPGHRIVWINIHNGLDPAAGATFNRVLAEAVASRTDVVIGDWAAAAPRGGNLLGDGIHLTPVGTVAFASLIAVTATATAR
jgi:hypothetical protein